MCKRVLLTGASGFLGSLLLRRLRAEGYNVTGLDMNDVPEEGIVGCDLRDAASTEAASERIRDCDLVIHAAAITPFEKHPTGESCMSANLQMTRNLCERLKCSDVPMIFLSSVAVYGGAGRRSPRTPDADLRARFDYGVSKLGCEEYLRQKMNRVIALRLCPVINTASPHGTRERVFLPKLPFRFHFVPQPRYSLVQPETVVGEVIRLCMLEQQPDGFHSANLCDPKPYAQAELCRMFDGPLVPLPTFLLLPLYWCFHLIPGNLGYRLRWSYGKLFFSNLYAGCSESYPVVH